MFFWTRRRILLVQSLRGLKCGPALENPLRVRLGFADFRDFREDLREGGAPPRAVRTGIGCPCRSMRVLVFGTLQLPDRLTMLRQLCLQSLLTHVLRHPTYCLVNYFANLFAKADAPGKPGKLCAELPRHALC